MPCQLYAIFFHDGLSKFSWLGRLWLSRRTKGLCEYLWTANKNLLVLNKKIQERFLQALQFLNMFWILSKYVLHFYCNRITIQYDFRNSNKILTIRNCIESTYVHNNLEKISLKVCVYLLWDWAFLKCLWIVKSHAQVNNPTVVIGVVKILENTPL